MSFDGLFMKHINDELKQALVGGRVNKIIQPSQHDLVFSIRSQRKNQKLLFCIHPVYTRYHLTNENYFTPETTPNFCILLRKYLEGAILLDIQQMGVDRITTFLFQKYDELGDRRFFHFTVELMGRHSNLFLIDPTTNTIIDCIKYVSFADNSYRAIRPNAQYVLPPYQHKKNPFQLTKDELVSMCQSLDTPSSSSLQSTFQGLGKSSIEWVAHYQSTHHVSTGEALYRLTQEKTQASASKKEFYPVAMGESVFDSLGEMLDFVYAEKAKLEQLHQLSGNLIGQLQQIILRNQGKLVKLQETLVKAKNADVLRIKGEVLSAYAHDVKRGQTHVTLPNFYTDNEPIVIALKPEKSAQQNAQAYFKKYQKLKQSTHFVKQQMHDTTQEIDYLETVLVQINMANTQDLVAIRDELIATGYVKARATHKKKQPKKSLNPRVFLSSSGIRILVGRNNLQNDQLSLKSAKKTNYWLHTKNIPGSHVIVESDYPDEKTLYEAAMIAAYYSKFQTSANVPVDYVQVKHLKKPNGAKPGYVIYEQQKTLFVSPTKELVDSLERVFQ